MDDDSIVARLGELGLTTYEAKTYVALTRRDSSTAAEAARIGGVPRQRVYDVLASLVEKGARRGHGRGVWSSTRPRRRRRALEGLLARRREDLATLEQSAGGDGEPG